VSTAGCLSVRFLWLAAVMGLSAAWAEPVAEAPPDPARAAAEALSLIERERQTLRVQTAERQLACRQRVFVNPCISEVEVQERQLLKALRAREIRIEESERVRQRDAALQRSQEAQSQREQSAAATPEDPQAAQVARRAQAQADRQEQAQARVQRQQDRQSELDDRRRSLDDEARRRARPAQPSAPATP